MPLIHTGGEISRLIGAITAIEPPFWLGAQPLTLFKITDTHVISPEEQPQDQALPPQRHDIAGAGLRERFRVYRGGIE
jgi:hypothetical protein